MSEPRIGIEKVLRDYAAMNPGTPWRSKCEEEAADEIQSLRQRVERLERALRPFARIEVIEPSGHIVGLERYDFERARAALSPKVQEGE